MREKELKEKLISWYKQNKESEEDVDLESLTYISFYSKANLALPKETGRLASLIKLR